MSRFFLLGLFALNVASANTEPPLPSWNAEDRKRMIGDGWIAGGSLLTHELLFPEDGAAAPPLHVDKPTTEELATAPEDENEVQEEYLADYFAEKPEGHLVDPQNLLSTKQRKDLEVFLDYHAGDSSIDMYVYLFGSNQQIPGDVREEEVVERLYSVGKPALVLYYYLGAPQRSTIYLSPVITDTVSAAEQRRASESSVMQAFGSTKPFDQMEAFLVQMSIRIYWMERMAAGTAEETMEIIPEGERARAFRKKTTPPEKPLEIPPWARLVAWAFAACCGGLLTMGSLVIWWRARIRYRFPEFEVEPRLGGSHAAGIGAVISFASPAIPPAMQRNQVPDYMRRA
jgi:hypothetical protein